MQIIQDNATLMAYIPNVVSSVEGEQNLYEKITPHLTVVESWLFRKVVNEATVATHDEVMGLVRTIVACEAFRLAVPSLNVIMTSNGFGIVSNSTVAPASKDRTDALCEALIELRDNAIEQLVFALSGVGTKFIGTVFQGFEAQRMQGVTTHLFDKFWEQRAQIFRLQHDLAADAVSELIMSDVTNATYTDHVERTASIDHLHALLPGIIVKQLKGENCKDDIKRVVDYIRTHTTAFPYWSTSEAAKNWEDYTFKNDKKAGGYWLC